MDVSFTSVLNFDGITRSCWKTCDSDVGLTEYRPNRSTFPSYRDKNTLAEFLEVADFFGCVDICQSANESERLTLLFPIGLGGKYEILVYKISKYKSDISKFLTYLTFAFLH